MRKFYHPQISKRTREWPSHKLKQEGKRDKATAELQTQRSLPNGITWHLQPKCNTQFGPHQTFPLSVKTALLRGSICICVQRHFQKHLRWGLCWILMLIWEQLPKSLKLKKKATQTLSSYSLQIGYYREVLSTDICPISTNMKSIQDLSQSNTLVSDVTLGYLSLDTQKVQSSWENVCVWGGVGLCPKSSLPTQKAKKGEELSSHTHGQIITKLRETHCVLRKLF